MTTRNRWYRRALSALLASGLSLGCNPGVFVDLEDGAPVVAFNKPSGFGRTTYGTTVAAIDGRLSNGAVATRVAVGGGTDTGTWTYEIWNADDVAGFGIASKSCETPADDCVAGSGSTIVGLPGFAGEGVCVLIGEAAAHQVRVRCETDLQMVPVRGVTGTGFGTAAAAAPVTRAAPTRSAAIVGAPAAGSGAGALYRLPVDGSPVLEVTGVAAGASLGTTAALGSVMASADLPDTNALYTVGTPFLVAATAPGMNRVVLVAVGVDAIDSSVIAGQVLGCVDGAAGFGGSLAAGDVDGDGLPEVYVGHVEGDNHPESVTVIDLADISSAGQGCAATDGSDDPATTTITCPTIGGDACGDVAFGAALAVADVSADGSPDLLVGAPQATIAGKSAAGAVYALAGSSSGVDASTASRMEVSEPGMDDRLGASLAAVRTHVGLTVAERFEVVAGAPGAQAAYMFMCSGLGDDTPDGGDRCLELPTE